MPICQLSPSQYPAHDAWVKAHPQGTLWQSDAWRRFLEAAGRSVRIYAAMESDRILAGALVSIDRTALGLSVWEVARGPLAAPEASQRDRDELLRCIETDAKQQGAMTLFVAPPEEKSPFAPEGFSPSKRLVHAQATRIVDLAASEEEILAQMKQKGRYNIRVAERAGVEVRESNDLVAYVRLSKQTGKRDGFVPRSLQTYHAFLESLPGSFLLLAYAKESPEPIAGLLGVIWNNMGIYYYGASSHAHRALMAPYALQWAAMRRCKTAGCHAYDLLGIAPEGSPKNHPWNGISDFKERFGGTVVTYPPECQKTLRPFARAAIELKRKIFH